MTNCSETSLYLPSNLDQSHLSQLRSHPRAEDLRAEDRNKERGRDFPEDHHQAAEERPCEGPAQRNGTSTYLAMQIAMGMTRKISVIIRASAELLGRFSDEFEIVTKHEIYHIPITAHIISENQ